MVQDAELPMGSHKVVVVSQDAPPGSSFVGLGQFRVDGDGKLIEIPVEAGASLAGRVLGDDGAAAPKRIVPCIVDAAGYGPIDSVYSIVSDDRGAFTLDALPPHSVVRPIGGSQRILLGAPGSSSSSDVVLPMRGPK